MKVLLQIGCKAFASGPADLGTNHLDRRHQGVAKWHCPKHSQSELGTGLGVGDDATWVIVRNAGDKAWADPCQGVLLEFLPDNFKSHIGQDSCFREPMIYSGLGPVLAGLPH